MDLGFGTTFFCRGKNFYKRVIVSVMCPLYPGAIFSLRVAVIEKVTCPGCGFPRSYVCERRAGIPTISKLLKYQYLRVISGHKK